MGCAAPHPMHWKDLRDRAAGEILRLPGVRATPDGRGFEVGFLSARYRVDPDRQQITEIESVSGRQFSRAELVPGRKLSQAFQILLLRYLLAPHGGEPEGREITEKELPGGPTFFRGPHALEVGELARRFGSDPDGFEQRGRRLGGEKTDQGDRAIRLVPFPGIPVTFVLWLSDEEFEASVSVLFDRSIQRWFELDMIFLLVGQLAERMLED